MLHSHSLHIQIPLLSIASFITSTTFISLSLALLHTHTPMMKMALPLSLRLSLFLLLLHAANGHDITQILSQYPEFSTFNSYLTLTNLAAQINTRQPVTILVVDNANLAALSVKPVDQIKNILSVHVVLDYYDAPKLQTLSATSALGTTLFQTTGVALGQQGFLNITRLAPTGSIAFASAMPGSPAGSTLVKSVYSLPYNLSILQVSTAIIPQGIDGTKTSSPPSKAPSATPVATVPPPSSVTPPANSSSPPVASAATPTASAAAAVPSTAPPTAAAKAPIPATASPKPSIAPIPSTAPPMSSKAPAPSSVPPMAQVPAIAATPSASPASTPTANAPGPALAPGAETPTLETPGETTPAEAKPKGKSAGQTLDSGLAVVFTMVLSTLYLASSTI